MRRVDFTINFETRSGSPVAIASKAYEMPNKPMVPDAVNGTCALKTEVSAIHVFWAGFNLTLEFIKNPEGNSYYMNRVVLIYNTEHPSLKGDFAYANTHGKIHLETRPGKNFFFTPLGKAYLCYKAENQVGEKSKANGKNPKQTGKIISLCPGPFEIVER